MGSSNAPRRRSAHAGSMSDEATATDTNEGDERPEAEWAAMVETVMTGALERVSHAASRDDVVRGLLAGLKLVRDAIDAQAGYDAVRRFDEMVRGLLIGEAVERGGTWTGRPLPSGGAGRSRSVIILRDAAASCLTLNAFGPDNLMVELATMRWVEQLVTELDGPPHWRAVTDHLSQTPADPLLAEHERISPPMLQ